MSQQIINVGTNPNDGTGDPARTAFTKTNSNFTELYNDVTAIGFTAVADSTPPSAQLGYIYNATATPPFAAPPTANVTANVTT